MQLDCINELRLKSLDDAIHGELTKEWRRINYTTESAEELVYRFKINQDNWIKENKKKGYKEAFTIEKKLKKVRKNSPQIPHVKLPPSWAWSSIIEISQIIVDCHNKTAPYINEGIPLVRTSNIRNGELDLISTKYVSEDTYKRWSQRCPPVAGDILFTREAPVGEGAIIPKEVTLCMGQRMMLIRVNNDFILRDYLLLLITSPDFLIRISKFKKGTMIGHLRVSDVENFIIPVPPFKEQAEIVAKINHLRQYCKSLKDEITNNQKNIESFYHNYLIRMFGDIPEYSQKYNLKQNLPDKIERIIKFNPNTLDMELVDLLKEHSKLHAEDLWKMSKYFDNKNIGDSIDKFYADLKKNIEIDKTVKEVENEKGYLELV